MATSSRLNTDPSGETNSIQVSLTPAAQCKAEFEPCDERCLAEQKSMRVARTVRGVRTHRSTHRGPSSTKIVKKKCGLAAGVRSGTFMRIYMYMYYIKSEAPPGPNLIGVWWVFAVLVTSSSSRQNAPTHGSPLLRHWKSPFLTAQTTQPA